MAKLSVVILFLFFILSFARTPLTENDVTHLKLPSENDVILPELRKNLPVIDVILPELPKTLQNDFTQLKFPLENDVIISKLSKNLPRNDVDLLEHRKTTPESDVKQLKFPSENDVNLHEFPRTIPESDDSTSTVNLPSKFDHEETRSIHSVPLKLVRFRPINRRFRIRSNLPFRLCHHHVKPISQRQINFGNDMILSSQRKSIDFDKFVYRIGVRQIPSDPFNFHQYNDKKNWKFLDDREKFGEKRLKDQSPQISKFLEDREKIWGVKKDQSPHHHHHDDDNEDNDHEQRKISKFLEDREKIWGVKKDQSPHHHHHDVDNEDNDHEQRKISKFLEDREKIWGGKLNDQSPHHHHHHNKDNDDQQRMISKFQITHENEGNFGEIKSKNEHQFRTQYDDEAEKRSKLFAEYNEMKLRKRFRDNAGEGDDEKAKEKKKGGFMRGIRKFLHHYFD